MMPFSPKPKLNLQPRPAALPERHKIMLAGLELRPDLSGALHIPDMSALIISDLHLEQGTSLARRGIRVPPFDTNITISMLEQVIARFAPQRLIFLGDSFHDDEGEMRVDEALMSRLQKIATVHECFWICGNHDPSPPRNLAGHASDHILLRAAWEDASDGLINVDRLGVMLKRIKGHILHRALERVSPLAVPVLLEIGRESIQGSAHDALLAEAEAELAAESSRLA